MFQGAFSRTLEVYPSVYSFSPSGNVVSMFVVTGGGVVVVEPCSVAHSTQMLQEIREVTQAPIRYLIHSHDHWDHSSGGQVWRDAGAQILAHSEAVESMRANANPDTAVPDLQWLGDTLDMDVGGTKIKLHYLGINHGLGMTVVNLVDMGILYIADLVSPHRIMFTTVPDFNIREWERSIQEILDLEWDLAVCSHSGNSDPMIPATRSEAAALLQYIKDLRQAVRDLLAAGNGAFSIPSMISLPAYADWDQYDGFLEANAWRILWDEIMGPFAWRNIGQEEKLSEVKTRDVSNTVLH